MAAGCSMADMAMIEQVEACWDELGEVLDTEDITPVTYINSAASLKAFCGKHGGIVCTSSNAAAVLELGFRRTSRVLFFPDQHLGRNTAHAMGIPLEQMPVWDPHADEFGGNTRSSAAGEQSAAVERALQRAPDVPAANTSISSERNSPASRYWCIRNARARSSPQADIYGSTGKIIREVEQAPAGTKWAIGTELHLVKRLKQEHPEQEIHFLSPVVCMCATMYRIDLAHLCWSLENLAAGTPVNVIEVDAETSRWALVGAGADAGSEIARSIVRRWGAMATLAWPCLAFGFDLGILPWDSPVACCFPVSH